MKQSFFSSMKSFFSIAYFLCNVSFFMILRSSVIRIHEKRDIFFGKCQRIVLVSFSKTLNNNYYKYKKYLFIPFFSNVFKSFMYKLSFGMFLY